MIDIIERATKDFYWGILPREEMQRFVEAAKTQGFEEARKTFPFSIRFDYADDFSRADFNFFLPSPKNAQVLDLGSGFGNVTIPISYHYENVTAVDASRELLEISSIRAAELSRKNITFVHADPLGSSPLPFADDSFDLIILNGVLEWVGLSGEKESPRDIQGFLLEEIRRVLRPGGAVYIGIENRWFPGWVKRDPHSKLPYTVFLPRKLADWYARRHGITSGYRTYIYGYGAYRKLFAERGFSIEKLLIPYTTYRDATVIYPRAKEISAYLFKKGSARTIYTAKWQAFLRILRIFNVEHLMVASFMFVLTPFEGSAASSSLMTRLLALKHPDTFRDTDLLMKVPSGSADTLLVQALRSGAEESYGSYRIVRLPDAMGNMTTSFEPSKSESQS